MKWLLMFQVILVILKAMHIITCAWWIVLLPAIVVAVIALVIIAIIIISAIWGDN